MHALLRPGTLVYSPARLGSALILIALMGGCGSSGGDGGDADAPPLTGPPPALEESRAFRAIAGVSMGGYGALNLGTKYPDYFGVIGSLGGPVDMQELLRHSVEDNLEVKAQTEIPRQVPDDFTYDHLPPYPDRDTRVAMFQDLTIAFGNPFLHHPDPARRYLAADSEPAARGVDDQLGSFTVPADPRGFLDGGDGNKDGLRQSSETPNKPNEVGLLAVGSLPMLASGAAPVDVGGRMIADLNEDGIFDVGEGLVVNLSEPFDDPNQNRVFEPELGETFTDSGLDGVAGNGDFGEGNGQFDDDPDRGTWLAQDPLTRLAGRTADAIATQRLYMDVGLQDQFGFALHYADLVEVLEGKGLSVVVRDGFDSNCADLPDRDEQFVLVRYNAGHIGVSSVDPDDLAEGDVCGENTVWQRILSLIGFLEESFPDGTYGAGDDFDDFIDIDFDDIDIDIDFPDPDLRGEVNSIEVTSNALAAGGAAPVRDVVVYLPPAFSRSDDAFPVVYFLGGYGQKPEDFERVGLLLDALILTGQLQNMFFVFLPGDGGRQGSFYVNHVIPHAQVPELQRPTSGRYEDSTIQDLIPFIEDRVLKRRVKR
jgi:enterochelin esterase-like enzyme